MTGNFKFDSSRWLKASHNLAGLSIKKEPQDVLKAHVKGVLKIIVALTPPATGTLDANAKTRGENAILGSLLKLAIPVAAAIGGGRDASGRYVSGKAELDSAADLLASHQTAWRGGVLNPGNRKKLLIEQSQFNAVAVTLQKLVGTLAAGWNAAAAALGLSMPTWIKRHGDRYGSFKITITPTRITITIISDVPFVDHVDGLERRVQKAFDYSAASLERQYEAALQRLARKSGFR